MSQSTRKVHSREAHHLAPGIAPAATVAALALTLAACGGDNNDGDGGDGGAASPAAITDRRLEHRGPDDQGGRSELFNEENPDVKITVGESGTGGGFEKFCAGETDMNDASRPIEDEDEAPICEENGVELPGDGRRQRRPHRDRQQGNDWATCLTTEQLKMIWEPKATARSPTGTRSTRRSPTRSSTSTGPAPTRAPSTTSPTRSTVKRAPAVPTTPPSEDDNIIVQGVAGSEGGLGYFGYTYYEENTDTLNAVADRQRRRLRGPERRDRRRTAPTRRWPVRCSSTRRSPAERQRGLRRRSSSTTSRTTTTIAEAAQFIPLSEDQKTHARRRAGRLPSPRAGL